MKGLEYFSKKSTLLDKHFLKHKFESFWIFAGNHDCGTKKYAESQSNLLRNSYKIRHIYTRCAKKYYSGQVAKNFLFMPLDRHVDAKKVLCPSGQENQISPYSHNNINIVQTTC